MSEDLSYPIGKFDMDFAVTPELRRERIAEIAALPAKLTEAVAGLDDSQLDTPYRPDGWTVRQTVHHVPDSHMNALVRIKLALTEDDVTIKPYYEDRWAELGDSRLPVDVSLRLVDAVHTRWVALLESLNEDQYRRHYVHPETGDWTVEGVLALYAWHGQHHTAHITSLRHRMGW